MRIRIIVLFALALLIPLAGSAEQDRQSIDPGTYKGPGGQTIQIKQSVRPGGRLSDLAAKGIIIITGKPSGGSRESDKGIIIVEIKPADGAYVGPGGAGFLVKQGIIVQKPTE